MFGEIHFSGIEQRIDSIFPYSNPSQKTLKELSIGTQRESPDTLGWFTVRGNGMPYLQVEIKCCIYRGK